MDAQKHFSSPFAYPADVPQFSISPEHGNGRWLRSSVTFSSPLTTPYPGMNTASGEYYQPKTDVDAPLVILLHGWGDHSAIPCRWLARGLAGKGFGAFLLRLPTHTSRFPPELRERAHDLTMEEWLTMYRVGVSDLRRVTDWASAAGRGGRPVAVIGLSLGGFMASIAMGIDERITAGVLLVTGGNSEKIMQMGRLARFRHLRQRDSEYRQGQKEYRQFRQEVMARGLDAVVPPKLSYLIDPLTYAHLLRNRPLLMVNARWDEFVPREAALDLWQECGRCAISWFASNHTGIWLYYPLILGGILRFLRQATRTGG